MTQTQDRTLQFELTEEQRAIRALARELAQGEIAPHIERWDRAHEFPRKLYTTFAQAGLMGLTIPEAPRRGRRRLRLLRAGDRGAGARRRRDCDDALGPSDDRRRDPAPGECEAQRERYLPLLAGGDAIAAFALTEADVGFDAAALRATATRQGDGYVLRGRKQWCTNGSHAALTMGMFRTGGPGSKGISAFLIENDRPGLRVEKVTEKLGRPGGWPISPGGFPRSSTPRPAAPRKARSRQRNELLPGTGRLMSFARFLVAALMAIAPCGLAATGMADESRVAKKPPGPPSAEHGFILGADLSWVQQQEDEGIRFSDRGAAKDIFSLLKDRRFNAVRLRLFNNPKAKNGYSAQGYCDLDHTLRMARRIHAAGMQFLLDFHYSDTWADPGHQIKPAAWTDLHGPALEKAVRDYTRNALAALKKQGVPPAMVQIGNEISNGFLWPDGNVWKSGRWDTFCGLIKAGIAGAKEADPSIPIMLHLAWGGQNAQSRAFLDHAIAEGVRFDCLGQSYYARWHGTCDDLKANLTDLAGRYPQNIVVVEYSVPNVRKINDIVHGLPGGKGLGTFIWEPTRWEGPALFDKEGNTKSEIDAYETMAKDYGRGAVK